MGKRCEEAGLWCKKPWERTEEDGGAGTDGGRTKRGSYFPRIRKYRPCGRPAAEGRQGLVLEDWIARRASSRNRSSTSNSFRNTRKKREPAWIRGRQKVVGKETEWDKKSVRLFESKFEMTGTY